MHEQCSLLNVIYLKLQYLRFWFDLYPTVQGIEDVSKLLNASMTHNGPWSLMNRDRGSHTPQICLQSTSGPQSHNLWVWICVMCGGPSQLFLFFSSFPHVCLCNNEKSLFSPTRERFLQHELQDVHCCPKAWRMSLW